MMQTNTGNAIRNDFEYESDEESDEGWGPYKIVKYPSGDDDDENSQYDGYEREEMYDYENHQKEVIAQKEYDDLVANVHGGELHNKVKEMRDNDNVGGLKGLVFDACMNKDEYIVMMIVKDWKTIEWVPSQYLDQKHVSIAWIKSKGELNHYLDYSEFSEVYRRRDIRIPINEREIDGDLISMCSNE